MIFTHFLFQAPLDLTECTVQQLVFENPMDLTRMISELNQQINGYQGSFSVSQGGGEIDFKRIAMIVDPWNIDVNNRDIVNGFMRLLLNSLTSKDNMLRTEEIFSEALAYITHVASEIENSVEFEGIDYKGFLKNMGFSFSSENNLRSNIVDYIRLAERFGGIRLFVLVNIGTFLSDDECKELIHQIEYLNIPTIFFERSVRPGFKLTRVFDQDFCEIAISEDSNLFEV